MEQQKRKVLFSKAPIEFEYSDDNLKKFKSKYKKRQQSANRSNRQSISANKKYKNKKIENKHQKADHSEENKNLLDLVSLSLCLNSNDSFKLDAQKAKEDTKSKHPHTEFIDSKKRLNGTPRFALRILSKRK